MLNESEAKSKVDEGIRPSQSNQNYIGNPALQLEGGSFCKSLSSFKIFFEAMAQTRKTEKKRSDREDDAVQRENEWDPRSLLPFLYKSRENVFKTATRSFWLIQRLRVTYFYHGMKLNLILRKILSITLLPIDLNYDVTDESARMIQSGASGM